MRGEIGVRSIWHTAVWRMRRSRSFVYFAYISPFHCVMIKRTSHERTSLFTGAWSSSSATFTRDCELRRGARQPRTNARRSCKICLAPSARHSLADFFFFFWTSAFHSDWKYFISFHNFLVPSRRLKSERTTTKRYLCVWFRIFKSSILKE